MSARRTIGNDSARLDASLAAAAEALQLQVSPDQSARLLDFVELLFRWNRTYNLTAIRDLSAIVTHHVVDSLAAVRPLRRELAGRARPSVLDVGSGGGLPGVVFAIMNPTLGVVCVDAVGKKTAFVRHAAASLKLENLRAEHARVEEMANGRFDVISSRAFASLAIFTGLTEYLLADTGVWMAMKGRVPDEEIAALPATVRVFHVEPLVVPGVDGDRCLVWMRPTAKQGAETQPTGSI